MRHILLKIFLGSIILDIVQVSSFLLSVYFFVFLETKTMKSLNNENAHLLLINVLCRDSFRNYENIFLVFREEWVVSLKII